MRSVRAYSPGNASMKICHCCKELVILSKAKTLTVPLAWIRLDNMVCRLHTVLGWIQDFVIEAVINF